MGEFVQHLHLIRFYDVFNLQTWAISWFVYPAVCCVSLPCRLGCHRRQPPTVSFGDQMLYELYAHANFAVDNKNY